MNYKAVILDIDGTLMNYEQPYVSDATIQTVAALREQGVKVVIATGRGPFRATPEILSGLQYDHLVCVNGACVLDTDGSVLFSNSLSEEQIFELYDYLKDHNATLTLTFLDGYYVYHNYKKVLEYNDATGNIRYINDEGHTRHKQSLPFGGFTKIADADAEAFNTLGSTVKLVIFQPGSYDICKVTTDKSKALTQLLEHLDIPWEETVAIGDGANDVEMLSRAGLGVAMGSATDRVKSFADRVTGSVAEEGVATALRDIFGLAE